VAYVDRFGTLVLDVLHPGTLPGEPGLVEVAGERGTAGRTFADIHPGGLVIYRGSIGYVEVAVRDGSAAALLGLKAGDRISVGPWRNDQPR
jgi:S-adenosylmethionine hydrolase